jgi:YVTN family beta-propeller protein
VIDADTLTVVRSAKVGLGPRALALDRRRSRVYTANFDDNTVSVLDTPSMDLLATVTVGRLPHAMAVDPRSGCVYVANAGSGSVSVIACDGAADARSERETRREGG